MTVGAWIFFIFLVIIVSIISVVIISFLDAKRFAIAITIVIWLLIVVGCFFGMRWYYANTATGQREIIDQNSNFANGMDRIINVYTANGDLIATYEGRIDIDANDGGYVKFDFEGKRYIYYNCFIESIANIE